MENTALNNETTLSIEKYFDDFNETLKKTLEDEQVQKGLLEAVDIVRATKPQNKKIILVGNGGSSAIAEHMAIDFTKNAGLKAITVSGSPQLTTFANDYGFENVFAKGVEAYGEAGDVLMAISSGGESPNIINAVTTAKQMGCKIITFSAFKENNSLRQMGDINIYVPSEAYGYIEIIHNVLIHFINDKIIGKAVYKFR